MTAERSGPRAQWAEPLLAAAALLLALAALELLGWLANRAAERRPHPHGEMADFTRYHPVLGWDGIPGVRLPLLGQVVTLNSQGNRSPEVPVEKPTGVRRVVLLGDSQAWGLGMADDQTIGARLESRLNARGGERWQVVNLGVSGYGTDQAFLKHLLQGRRYEPDVVVEVAFKNDISENESTLAWNVGKPRFSLEGGRLCLGDVPPVKVEGWPEDALLPEPPRLLAWSQLWRFLQHRSWRLKAPPRPDPADLERLRPQVDCLGGRQGYSGDGETIMKALLRRLDALERGRGGRFLTLFVPRPVEYRPERPRPSYYGVVMEELRQAGLAVLDLKPYAVERNLTAEELFLPKDSHLSARGSDLVAEMLAGEIR